MHPDLADRFDQHLWELMLKVHTGLPRREIIHELDFLRMMYQGIKTSQIIASANQQIAETQTP